MRITNYDLRFTIEDLRMYHMMGEALETILFTIEDLQMYHMVAEARSNLELLHRRSGLSINTAK